MPTRIRTVQGPVLTGSCTYLGMNYQADYYGPGYAKCEDVQGVGSGFPFTVNKITQRSGGTLTRSYDKDNSYRNWPATAIRDQFSLIYFHPSSAMGLSTNGAYASSLLAKTNPSRPDVDLPVFIAELKDLPSLVFDAGGKLIRMMARHHLRTHFGVIPLVKDLISMCNFVALTEKRMVEIKSLEKKGLSRTRTLENASAVSHSTVNMNSDRGWLALNRPMTQTTTCKVWGHVKWHPKPGFPSTNADQLSLARRAVLGLTVDASTAWELIPFSWLIDWFGSVGTYLAATRNIIPCFPSTPQIMRHYVAETFVSMGGSGSDFHSRYEEKQRRTSSASILTAHMPFLSNGQLAVLGSLTILKVGKYA